jgi:hypothetical protein
MRISIPLAATVLALAAGQARGETVEVSSTTMLQLGQQTRGGSDPTNPQLVTVAPLFEILSISAREVGNPLVADLSLFVSTWGSYDFSDLRWDAGTTSKWNGDFQTLYAQGTLLDRHLTLRLGRELVSTGVARMIQIDGGDVVLALPAGFRVSGYVGAPVAQRFQARNTLTSWNPVGGDLAYGGRVAWAYGAAGYPGRGLELGASANWVEDHGNPVRQEVGVDLRLQPLRDLTLTGLASYSVYDERASELLARASYSFTRALRVEVDAHYVAPDLFLARNSILSVFTAEDRQDYGGAFTYQLGHGLGFGAGYHLVVEPGEAEGSTYYGSEAHANVEWEHGPSLVGVEYDFLDAFENGYNALRLFGRRDMGRYFAALDVMGYLFRQNVNGVDYSVTGTLTAGVELAKGFSAVIAGTAGTTPFMEQTYSLMAKLAYNASYRTREVR